MSGLHNREIQQQRIDTFKVETPFEVKVEWMNGDITHETVLGDDGSHYVFDMDRHDNFYAPHSFCTVIKKPFKGIIMNSINFEK